ncbi:hypothetical protein ACFFRR_010907 [Megaselia abdita]
MSEIKYRNAETKDEEAVLQLLRDHFYPDEPLNKSKGSHDKADEDFAIGTIKHGLCTIAEVFDASHPDGYIVGCRLSYPSAREDVEAEEPKTSPPTTDFEKIVAFLGMLEAKSNVFQRFNVEKIAQGHMLSVHKDFRGKGIAKQLYVENIELARKLGYPIYVCDCTSLFSAKLCEKLGMELTATMQFDEFADANGNAYYQPPPPHDFARSFALRL